MTDQATAPAPSTNIASDIATVNAIRQELLSTLVERDAEIDLLAKSLMSGTHGLIIGAPGAAKSMTVREWAKRITGATYWETLFRKSLPVEQVVGPVSLQGLTNDVFRYITTGKLPEANVAFGDEVFKANAVVLNALLTILNERIFHNDGNVISVPLWSFIGASNELPTEQELMAFRDRFAWCRITTHVKTDDGFKAILRGQVERNAGTATSANPTTIDHDAILRLQSAVRAVTVGDDVLNDLAQLRRKAEGEANLYVSPRRYGEGVKLAQAQALLCGRDYVTSDDLTILKHVLWTDEEDVAKADELTLDFAGKVAREAAKLRSAFEPLLVDLLALKNEMQANGGQMTQESIATLAPLSMNIKKVEQQIEAAVNDAHAASRDSTELDALMGNVKDSLRIIRDEIMG